MTVEQSPLERFSGQKQQPQPPILNAEKEAVASSPGVIDLTNDGSDKEDDIKKAIALSLKDHAEVLGGQVSMEDQDISRVVEASLADSKAVGTKRKRGEVWQDPLNPHDRKRNGSWPVGLKNVGNTCWFSAVIQSLFHLPIFRKLVLSYSLQDWNVGASERKEQRNLLFMKELRKLFALLLSSKRKYVDPSHALEEFKEAFPDNSGTDSQQDVSEFTHKLLEWLEEAFKVNLNNEKDSGDNMMEREENPMLNLFYGHYLSEGLNEGRMFCNEETFGQYPLQVNGFNNIHDSLEAAMAQEIESYDVMTKSGQESWFTRLPPVLLFELSRFQFNQQIGRPEKIHNKLEFPQVMFMDRYMEYNKATTRAIREKVRKLKEERDKLQRKLEKYLNYGSGSKKVPLSDVLQYTLDFAESQKPMDENLDEDIEMASPTSLSSTEGESPVNSPYKCNSMADASSLKIRNSSMSHEIHLSEETVPSPQQISQLELKILQSCLKRWRTEVEANVKRLQDNISSIENTIRDIYNDQSFQKKPYRLHAVLVHEGQAASGHYWAYVYCPKRQMWLKFNDVSVFESNWSELQKDSMGGLHYASAYCLLYVDQLRPDLFDDGTRCAEIGPELLNTLPIDLQQYVHDDNEAYQMEMMSWELEQTRKKDNSTMTASDNDCTIICEKRKVPNEDSASRYFSIFNIENGHFNMEHAKLLSEQTVKKVEKINPTFHSTVENAFSDLIQGEICKIKRSERFQSQHNDDPRLHHIGVYMLKNSKCCDTYINIAVLEQFLVPEVIECPSGPLIRKIAMEKLKALHNSMKQDEITMYKNWHYEYHLFRKLVSLFVTGVDQYYNHKKLPDALNMFIAACELNSQLNKLSGGNNRGLDSKLLTHFRRLICKELNDLVANEFESSENKNSFEALSVAYEHILPSMEFLASPNASEYDINVAEKIRNRWCTMLAYDLPSKPSPKQERLQDFLGKLLDSSNEMPKLGKMPIQKIIKQLNEKYQRAMALVKQSGEYRNAQEAA